jgi:hypothetical protein
MSCAGGLQVYGVEDWRVMTDVERAVLDGMLAFDFPGVEELRVQSLHARVRRDCYCGCGSLSFDVAPEAPVSSAESPLLVRAGVVGEDDQPAGYLMVWLDGGRLEQLDVGDGDPLASLRLDRLRWDTLHLDYQRWRRQPRWRRAWCRLRGRGFDSTRGWTL